MELTKWPLATKSYVEELQAEMRRVTWPSWPQVRATTAVVIAAVFLFAAYFAVVNYYRKRRNYQDHRLLHEVSRLQMDRIEAMAEDELEHEEGERLSQRVPPVPGHEESACCRF